MWGIWKSVEDLLCIIKMLGSSPGTTSRHTTKSKALICHQRVFDYDNPRSSHRWHRYCLQLKVVDNQEVQEKFSSLPVLQRSRTQVPLCCRIHCLLPRPTWETWETAHVSGALWRPLESIPREISMIYILPKKHLSSVSSSGWLSNCYLWTESTRNGRRIFSLQHHYIYYYFYVKEIFILTIFVVLSFILFFYSNISKGHIKATKLLDPWSSFKRCFSSY